MKRGVVMKLRGVMPAVVTPLREDESIHVPVLEQLLEMLLEKGADGFYIAGATGEGLALRPGERRLLAESAVGIVNGRKPCIIQIASTDFSEAVALAKHAEKCGADGISATPPLFFEYREDDVYNYYKALANAVHIPLMIYYTPAAGFRISAEFAARMFGIDNITAIKWTSPDYFQMIKLKEMTHGQMQIINGPDATFLMGLCAGADGGIGTTYNYLLEYYRKIYDSFMQGDIAQAQEYQRQTDRILAARPGYPSIPMTKALLEAMGFAVGNASFPMRQLTSEEKKTVVERLRTAGLKI